MGQSAYMLATLRVVSGRESMFDRDRHPNWPIFSDNRQGHCWLFVLKTLKDPSLQTKCCSLSMLLPCDAQSSIVNGPSAIDKLCPPLVTSCVRVRDGVRQSPADWSICQTRPSCETPTLGFGTSTISHFQIYRRIKQNWHYLRNDGILLVFCWLTDNFLQK